MCSLTSLMSVASSCQPLASEEVLTLQSLWLNLTCPVFFFIKFNLSPYFFSLLLNPDPLLKAHLVFSVLFMYFKPTAVGAAASAGPLSRAIALPGNPHRLSSSHLPCRPSTAHADGTYKLQHSPLTGYSFPLEHDSVRNCLTEYRSGSVGIYR